MGVSDGGDGAPGWEVYLTGLHLKPGSDTITNNSKAAKKTPWIDQVQKDLVPFPLSLTIHDN